MQHEARPVILATGCSTGIGLALARRLWRTDFRVVITARKASLHRFEKEAFKNNERFLIRPLDVTNAKDRKTLVDEICQLWGGINILINNAGISFRSVFEHITAEEEKKQLETNYMGPMALTRLILPSMRVLGRGKIINVSSMSGMLAMPTMSAYSASKFALEGASESLWYEMRPLGINVTLIQPGFVRSNSFRNVYYSKKAHESTLADDGPYADYYRYMAPFVEKRMWKSRTTPGDIADLIMKTVRTENPRLRIPATFDAKIFYILRRVLPRRLYHLFLFLNLPNIKIWGKEYTNKRQGSKRDRN